MTKQDARKIARANILKMTSAEKEWASGAIIDAVSSLDVFKSAKSVFVYLGTDTEPDTNELVGLSLALEKTVAVPKIKGEEMDAIAITPYSDFAVNKWGILEPHKGMVIDDDFDLVVIPLVAFDGLKRAGHGKGYYDKYLSKHSSSIKLGIAFDCQRVAEIEVEKHDIMLDMLVTEKAIITKKGESVNPYGVEK